DPANGTVAVGTVGSPSAIYVYKSDGTLLNIFTVSPANTLANAGLAWEDTAAGPLLAAMIQPSSGTASYSLGGFDQPTVTAAAATLSAPSIAVAGVPLTLTGSLTLSNGAALPSGTTMTITRTGPDGQVTPLSPPTPVTDGSFTMTDTPPAAGSYSYA